MAPFNDRDVRWALSHYIDRNQIVNVAFLGASQVSALPMPPYQPLLPYFAAVKDLLAKYDTLAFDPKKGDALLSAKGFPSRTASGSPRTASPSRWRSSAPAPSAPLSDRWCPRC